MQYARDSQRFFVFFVIYNNFVNLGANLET